MSAAWTGLVNVAGPPGGGEGRGGGGPSDEVQAAVADDDRDRRQDRRAPHPFRPLRETPAITYRCASTNRISAGTLASTAPAIMTG